MIENLIGKRYAEALSGSISESSGLGSALENLRAFTSALDSDTELSPFFAHPSISGDKKTAMVRDICDKLSVEANVQNLLLTLTERKKILYLRNITEYFEKVVDNRLNNVRVQVTSASELGPESIERLTSSLGKILGKTVLLTREVDPALLAGVVLRIGDLVVDATVKNRLALLKRTIEKEEVA
ncbi:MAG: ATP synthase F1 subunit delta [Gammaproteobacteria bacterium]